MMNTKIIKLASNTKYYGLKNNYTHKTSFKNKKCGDKIIIEFNFKSNKIKEFRYETEACIFCQASASILAQKINLFSTATIKDDIKKLILFTKNKGFKLPSKFKAFKELLNRRYISRFDCVIMPFNALLKALKI